MVSKLKIGVVAFALAFGLGVHFADAARALDFEAAKRHFVAGKKALGEKKFSKAAEAYRASYDVSKDPAVLVDVADAWAKNGDGERAIQSLRDYLAVSPVAKDTAAERLAVEQRLAELETKYKISPGQPLRIPPAPRLPHQEAMAAISEGALAQNDAAPASAAAPGAPSTAPATATASDAGSPLPTSSSADSAGVAPPASPGAPPEPAVAPSSPAVPAAAPDAIKAPEAKSLIGEDKVTPMRKAAWAMVATTVALLTAGAIMGLAAEERSDEISRQRIAVGVDGQPSLYTPQLETDLNQLASEGKTYNLVGISMMAASGATAIVAAALFGVDYARNKNGAKDKSPDHPKISILPSISPRVSGVAASIQF